MFEFDNGPQHSAQIKVVGIGGCGGNAINNMISGKMRGVDFIAANTDSQDLKSSLAPIKVQLGKGRTRGLGAGADPNVGRDAAEESCEELAGHLENTDMLFVAAGMGGGTGTGGAPVVARMARELGILTVGVVTMPFMFEGKRRTRHADVGLADLKEAVDSLIIIPNNRLLGVAGKNTSLKDAFFQVDQILVNAVRGISDLITVGGMVNVDFADVRAVMSMRGLSLMGTGYNAGDERAVEAAHAAISHPLLDNMTLMGARGVLVNITGPEDLTLNEINEAVTLIHDEAHEDALIIFGTVIDHAMEGVMVTVIATGFEQQEAKKIPEEKEKARETMIAATGTSNLEAPIYLRRERETPPSTQGRKINNTVDPYDSEKYDVPTFLRRRAD